MPLGEDIEALKRGTSLRKLTKSGSSSHPRVFYVTPDETSLLWKSKNKSVNSSTVHLADVQDIVPGRTTPAFNRLRASNINDELCFSLLLRTRTLDIICNTKKEYDMWFDTLKHLISASKGPNKPKGAQMDDELRFVTKEWQHCKHDKNGCIGYDQVVKLLQKLNMGFSTGDIKRMFREVDENNDKVLQFEEFVILFDKLRERPEVTAIFNELTDGGDQLSMDAMREFLRHTQKDFACSLEDCQDIRKKFSKTHSSDKDGDGETESLSLVDFTNYVSSTTANNIFDAPRHGTIYQNMQHPITHYWIASSHNTYLTGDQLRSESSVKMYQKALEIGCRCVELDCWDGETEPIIYHGHTLTTKITFRSVIETCKEYAFKTSPYPLILSLEVHTSLEQQRQMAQILVSVFGDALAKSLVGQDVPFLPSPEDLKYKVLIKGPALNPFSDDMDADDDDDDDDEDIADMTADVRAKYEEVQKKSKQDKAVAKPKVAKELSDLVYLKNTKFVSCQHSKANAHPWEMSSFSEIKVAKLLRSEPANFVEYNKRQMSRIYPKGTRVDSSNYDPVPSFCTGCQIVALNYQTSKAPMYINQGRFIDNGGCGYVLKPDYMTAPNAKFDPNFPETDRKTLKIVLLSGRQIPKPNQSEKGEVIDPYVIFSMNGVQGDNREHRSSTIQNNGFNPSWKETFVFDVTCPDLAILYMMVYDEDVGTADDFIGYFSLPFSSIQPGYRSVPLLNKDHTQIPFASLFLHISIA